MEQSPDFAGRVADRGLTTLYADFEIVPLYLVPFLPLYPVPLIHETSWVLQGK